MAFSGFEMDFFRFSISVWVRTLVWFRTLNSFEKLGFQYQVLNPNLETRVFVQASAVKPGICNSVIAFWCSAAKEGFQNLCSNPYFCGVKTRVSKFGFKTDVENPKLEKLKSTLISPKTDSFALSYVLRSFNSKYLGRL